MVVSECSSISVFLEIFPFRLLPPSSSSPTHVSPSRPSLPPDQLIGFCYEIFSLLYF